MKVTIEFNTKDGEEDEATIIRAMNGDKFAHAFYEIFEQARKLWKYGQTEEEVERGEFLRDTVARILDENDLSTLID